MRNIAAWFASCTSLATHGGADDRGLPLADRFRRATARDLANAIGSAPSGCVDTAVFSANPYATFTVTADASAPANCTATITVVAGPNTGCVYTIVP